MISRNVLVTAAAAISVFVALPGGAEETPVFKDVNQPVEARVNDLMSRLTLEEKLSIIHADSKFSTAAIPRLGIPRRWMSDGPNGVREDIGPDTWDPSGHTDDFSTCMPTDIGLAATWNPDRAADFGKVIGEEARRRGKQIMLGPAVNIMRTPLCGRNFEYMGEDPYLTSRIAVAYIKGEQAQGVSSCVKHFAANNQEWERGTINVELDERTLREIYLPAFRAAVQEAGVLSVMGAYNQIRGQHCCENDYLLNQILKKEWGFEGLVVSDWGGAHDTDEAVRNGLDLEMGTEKPKYSDYYLADAFLEGIKSGKYPLGLLDDKVRRNLRVMVLTHLMDPPEAAGSINTAGHQTAARQVAEEAMVLLKNDDNALPLDSKTIKSIAVIGENAVRKLCHGGESSEIKAFYEITPLEGIIKRAGPAVNVTFAMGYEQPPEKYKRHGKTTTQPTAEDVAEQQQLAQRLAEQAVAAAKSADVVIYVGGLNHSWGMDTEGSDRKDIKLPYGQDLLIQKITAANPRTAAVLIDGGAVEMDQWIDKVPAVVQAWYPGMEGGNAIASVLFGDVNPSGKLPCSFPKHLEDSPAHAMGNYPGKDGTVKYEEGLLVGYRWFDTKKIEPAFPFGFGLSYTTFAYSNAGVEKAGDGMTVHCDVANTGSKAGAAVVQVYLHQQHPSLMRPEKELKGFAKVMLEPGEKKTVSIPLNAAAFAFYDPDKKAWVTEADDFDVLIGSSSRDIRLTEKFKATAAVMK